MDTTIQTQTVLLIARLTGMEPAAVRSMFGRGYSYVFSLGGPEPSGWRDGHGAPPA